MKILSEHLTQPSDSKGKRRCYISDSFWDVCDTAALAAKLVLINQNFPDEKTISPGCSIHNRHGIYAREK
jgi:hypothetical protein